jgi:queuine tRNA-ribosyltransferase
VDRDYTARSTARTHRWLDRCIDWQRANAPAGQMLYGIVQGGVYEDLRVESAERVASSDVDGVAVGGSLGQEKAQMHEVVEWALRPVRDEQPRHLLGIGDVDDILHAVVAGIDTFDCATPTRLGRHGTALVPDPAKRWRLDLQKPEWRDSREPIADGCPCPACHEHTRGYLHYLARAKELTAARLITLHNLTFMALLMRQIREAIAGGELAAYSAEVLAGQRPY